MKVNRNPTKLPEFAGKPGESLQSFLNKIENGAAMGDWTPAYCRGQLYAQITGGALQYVDSLPDFEKRTYESLRAALRRRYEGDLERERSKEALRAVRRARNETLEDLGRRITELTRKAYPGSPERREEEGVYALRNAVSDKLSEQIVIQGYPTVDRCVEALARLECHQNHRNHARQARISQAEGAGEPQLQNRLSGGATQGPKRAPQSAPPARTAGPPQPTAVTVNPNDLKEVFAPILEDIRRGTRALTRSAHKDKPDRDAGPKGPGMGPSKERPCLKCQSTEHWAKECPNKANQGNDKGLVSGPRSQSSE